MNSKSLYNERFSFSDPGESTCRSTRHRAAKRKKTHVEDDALTLPPDRSTEQDTISTLHLDHTSQQLDNEPLANDCSTFNAFQDADEFNEYHVSGDDDDPEERAEDQDYDYLSSDWEFDVSDEQMEDGRASIQMQPGESPDHDVEHLYLQPPTTSMAMPLYEGSSLTAASSSVLIMKYTMKHNLTREALGDLLSLLKLHCPSPNTCPSTLYHFKKHFQDLQYKPIMHNFCNNCFQEITVNVSESVGSATCTNSLCKNDLTEKSLSSFIELPVELQLKSILESEKVAP